MDIRKKIESNSVVWFLGALMAAFGAGIGTYHSILEIARLEVIPQSQAVETIALQENASTVLAVDLEDLQRRNLALELELERLQSDLSSDKDEIREVRAINRRLGKELTNCKATGASYSTSLESLRRKNSDLELQLEALQTTLASVQADAQVSGAQRSLQREPTFSTSSSSDRTAGVLGRHEGEFFLAEVTVLSVTKDNGAKLALRIKNTSRNGLHIAAKARGEDSGFDSTLSDNRGSILTAREVNGIPSLGPARLVYATRTKYLLIGAGSTALIVYEFDSRSKIEGTLFDFTSQFYMYQGALPVVISIGITGLSRSDI